MSPDRVGEVQGPDQSASAGTGLTEALPHPPVELHPSVVALLADPEWVARAGRVLAENHLALRAATEGEAA